MGVRPVLLWQHVLLCKVMLLRMPDCGCASCALLRDTQQSTGSILGSKHVGAILMFKCGIFMYVHQLVY